VMTRHARRAQWDSKPHQAEPDSDNTDLDFVVTCPRALGRVTSWETASAYLDAFRLTPSEIEAIRIRPAQSAAVQYPQARASQASEFVRLNPGRSRQSVTKV
jgi:hypothetical protein